MLATEQNARVALRPVSGTPLWARPDAPGESRPVPPWDEWTIPPRPAALASARKPSPRPAEPFHPWRIGFERPESVDYPIEGQTESGTVTKRLVFLLGLAYLFFAALATGLVWTGHLDSAPNKKEPANALPPRPRPPERHPHSPGLHTRPDGSRYLVMPMPSDVADRLRRQAIAIGGGSA
ncbi:hypothetical protein [Glycomyces tarimensis]